VKENKSEVDDCCKKKDVNKNTKEKKAGEGENKKEEKEQKED